MASARASLHIALCQDTLEYNPDKANPCCQFPCLLSQPSVTPSHIGRIIKGLALIPALAYNLTRRHRRAKDRFRMDWIESILIVQTTVESIAKMTVGIQGDSPVAPALST